MSVATTQLAPNRRGPAHESADAGRRLEPSRDQRQRIVVSLSDTPRAVSAVLGVLAHRRVPVETLTVGVAGGGERRVDLAVVLPSADVGRVVKFLNRVVDVRRVVVLESGIDAAYVGRAALIRLWIEGRGRADALAVIGAFGADVLDVLPECVVIRVADRPARVAHLLDLLRCFGRTDVVDSGELALPRGHRARPREGTTR